MFVILRVTGSRKDECGEAASEECMLSSRTMMNRMLLQPEGSSGQAGPPKPSTASTFLDEQTHKGK